MKFFHQQFILFSEDMIEVCENYDLENMVTPLDVSNYEKLLFQTNYNVEKTVS